MSGEDGPETPSAPESPDSESPAAPAEPAEQSEPAEEGRAESARPRMLPVWILLGAAALAGGAWAVTERMGGGPPATDEASVPLITASAEPWKVRPDDPGGMEIPNQGTLIYETLTTADPEEAPERILPPPEEPLSRPKPEADRTEELAVAASGAENEVAALQPDAGGVDEPAAVTVEGVTPAEPEAPAPVVIEEISPVEPETLEETVPVQEAAPLEVELSDGETVPLPPQPKPGTLAAALIEESVLPDLDGPGGADDELTELEPETVALLEELFQRGQEPEAPSEPVQTDDADPVPLPPYKPVRFARAEPAREAPAVSVPESQSISGSRAWRYVQLGTADARGPLEVLWERLRRRHDDALVGLSPLIMPVDRGDDGIFYRLRAGPLTNDAAAQRVCERLKERGRECFVARD